MALAGGHQKVCGKDAWGWGGCLKFRISGISNAVRFNKSPDLSNTKSSLIKKLSFHVFENLGEELSSYWNVAYGWLTGLNGSPEGRASLCPPLERQRAAASAEVGGPQAAIFASCCSSFEMRSS